MAPYRQSTSRRRIEISWARSAHHVLAWVVLAGVVVQIVFAGAGVFGAAGFGLHAANGAFLGIASIGLLVLAALGRCLVRPTAMLFGLMMVQGLLADARTVEPWVAALHPLNAMAVLATAYALAMRAAPVTLIGRLQARIATTMITPTRRRAER